MALMFPSRDYGPLNVPKLLNIILDQKLLFYAENIRPPPTLCQLYLLVPGFDPGLLFLISVYNMGGDVCQTRDSEGPLQKKFFS